MKFNKIKLLSILIFAMLKLNFDSFAEENIKTKINKIICSERYKYISNLKDLCNKICFI